jgi:D-3-phosphoglycerate dehydrogenase
MNLVPGCVGWLVGIEPVSERVLRHARELRVLSRNGTGIDNIPLAVAEELGIRVSRAEGANARGVAELTLALALAALRHLPASHQALRSSEWKLIRGREVQGRTWGVIGCGAVGGIVGQLAQAFGARVLAFDPLPEARRGREAWEWASLEEALMRADIVSLHCPPLPDGSPLIDVSRLGKFRPGSILVNTARGTLVDEDAIVRALDDGPLDSYATDVFATEPPTNQRLLQHDRVIMTPHVGAATEESVQRASDAAAENLIKCLRDLDNHE